MSYHVISKNLRTRYGTAAARRLTELGAMKIQTKATRVLERTSHYINSGVIKRKPAWYDAVAAVPPSFDLTKSPKNLQINQREDPQDKLWKKFGDNFKTRTSRKEKKQNNNSVNRIPKLSFLEDQLRDVFYHQHPWELARPKILVENSGKENSECDWSRMLQLNKPLDGESVVQRTLWLLKEGADKRTLFEAYDQARFEYYQLRMADEMDSAVSKEESGMFGAVFLSSNIQWGIKKEQENIDRWMHIAERRTRVKEASKNKASASVGNEMPEEDSVSMWETILAEQPQTEKE